MVSGLWRVLITLQLPRRPDTQAWAGPLRASLQRAQAHTTTEDREIWEYRLANLDAQRDLPVDVPQAPAAVATPIGHGGRVKQGLLNLIGELSRVLFGTATSEESDDSGEHESHEGKETKTAEEDEPHGDEGETEWHGMEEESLSDEGEGERGASEESDDSGEHESHEGEKTKTAEEDEPHGDEGETEWHGMEEESLSDDGEGECGASEESEDSGEHESHEGEETKTAEEDEPHGDEGETEWYGMEEESLSDDGEGERGASEESEDSAEHEFHDGEETRTTEEDSEAKTDEKKQNKDSGEKDENGSEQADELEVVPSSSVEEKSRHRVPSCFSFTISPRTWRKCQPIGHERQYNVLQHGWTNVFYDGFSKHCDCVITFRGKVRKETSRKWKSAPYFHGVATCKFVGCGYYEITISSTPAPGEAVIVNVTRVGPDVQHKPGVIHKRPLTGMKRKSVGKRVRDISVSIHHYKEMGVTPEQKITAGNLTQSQSKMVLRKLESEMQQAERLHHDTFQEMAVVRRLLAGLDAESSIVKGFVQYDWHFPFVIHLYKEEQLRVYVQRRRGEGSSVWHLNATGSIIRSAASNKSILNYALVMEGAKPGLAPLPVAEMISSSHTIVTVTHFLSNAYHTIQKLTTTNAAPSVVVTDFSWTMIQAVLHAINHQDIVMFLRLSWKVLTGEIAWPVTLTKIHMCCAHFLHMISSNLKRVCGNKPLRQFVLFSVFLFTAVLVNCKSLDEASVIFKDLHDVLSNELLTDKVAAAYRCLCLKIKTQDNDLYAEEEELEQNRARYSELSDDEDMPRRRGLTIFEQSPFKRHFDALVQRPQDRDDVEDGGGITLNPHFSLDCWHVINKQMYILPLWSSCLLPEDKKTPVKFCSGKPFQDNEK